MKFKKDLGGRMELFLICCTLTAMFLILQVRMKIGRDQDFLI